MLSKVDRMHCYDLAQSKATSKGMHSLKNYANVHSLAIDASQAANGGLEAVKMA